MLPALKEAMVEIKNEREERRGREAREVWWGLGRLGVWMGVKKSEGDGRSGGCYVWGLNW